MFNAEEIKKYNIKSLFVTFIIIFTEFKDGQLMFLISRVDLYFLNLNL